MSFIIPIYHYYELFNYTKTIRCNKKVMRRLKAPAFVFSDIEIVNLQTKSYNINASFGFAPGQLH